MLSISNQKIREAPNVTRLKFAAHPRGCWLLNVFTQPRSEAVVNLVRSRPGGHSELPAADLSNEKARTRPDRRRLRARAAAHGLARSARGSDCSGEPGRAVRDRA